jgi:hypothetical protein
MKKLLFIIGLILNGALWAQTDSVTITLDSIDFKVKIGTPKINSAVGSISILADGDIVNYPTIYNATTWGVHKNVIRVAKGRNLAISFFNRCSNDSLDEVKVNAKVYTQKQYSTAFPYDPNKIIKEGDANGVVVFLGVVNQDLHISTKVGSSTKYECNALIHNPGPHGKIFSYDQLNPSGTLADGRTYGIYDYTSKASVLVKPDSGYYLKRLYWMDAEGLKDTLYKDPYYYPTNFPGDEQYFEHRSMGEGDSIFSSVVTINRTIYADFAKMPSIKTKVKVLSPALYSINHPLDYLGVNEPSVACSYYHSNFATPGWAVRAGENTYLCDENTAREIRFDQVFFSPQVYSVNPRYYAIVLPRYIWKNHNIIQDRNDTAHFSDIIQDTAWKDGDEFVTYIPNDSILRYRLNMSAKNMLADGNQYIVLSSKKWNPNSFNYLNPGSRDTVLGVDGDASTGFTALLDQTPSDSTIYWFTKKASGRMVKSLSIKGACYNPNAPWETPRLLDQELPKAYWNNGSISRTYDSLYISGLPAIDAQNCSVYEINWDIETDAVSVQKTALNSLQWKLQNKTLHLQNAPLGELILMNLKGEIVQQVRLQTGENEIELTAKGVVFVQIRNQNQQKMLFKKILD